MSADNDGGQTFSADDLKPVGFDATLGLEMRSAVPDEVVATMTIDPKHHQPYGIVHGGVYCAIAESVASISGVVWLLDTGLGTKAVGVNNSTDFLKSVPSGVITARSTPIHRGKRQQLWQVDMTDDSGQLLATSRVRLQNLA
ncbi:putative thioesterase [Gordonia effusa NBRC 100432]|uniref:Putative thioesterase n=1 Tax=Gordonia effusa NBRC 100432 TaxID=1077974 RepID=H0R4M7_9ACTN|nr:PaaI family thioesterase [Gordonia effusa]GAB20028.1 putative thioesterase [Gordonia effusa NBRC 100432]